MPHSINAPAVPGAASRETEGEGARDPLTGLPLIEAARARLAGWLEGEGQGRANVHALLLGLRRLETLNLAYGEATGDGALVEVARRVTRFAGDELAGAWTIARGPGGTFLLLADEACSRDRWQSFAGQLVDLVARPIPRAGGGGLRLSPHAALLRVPPGEEADSVLDRLAHTLAVAERAQGRRLVWADGAATRPGRRAADLEADLLKALDAGEIEVVFQPQFALHPDGDRLSGAEALARWNHSVLGQLGAGTLFAVAERADHVAPLSHHIATLALAAARDWPAHLRLSLNVTAADIAAPSFAKGLWEVIKASGFSPRRLTLEVTEQVLLGDLAEAHRALGELAARGIRMALDDFGAGFCNFRYLKALPLHYLKLDRAMVDGIAQDPRDLAVLRAIVAMASALDLAVIAEGIEDTAQREAVLAEGCAYYQGFLRASPMRADTFRVWAARQPRARG